jgi:lamin B
MYEREMTEVRSNKQVEISEIDGRLQEQYQARLQEEITRVREEIAIKLQKSQHLMNIRLRRLLELAGHHQ